MHYCLRMFRQDEHEIAWQVQHVHTAVCISTTAPLLLCLKHCQRSWSSLEAVCWVPIVLFAGDENQILYLSVIGALVAVVQHGYQCIAHMLPGLPCGWRTQKSEPGKHPGNIAFRLGPIIMSRFHAILWGENHAILWGENEGKSAAHACFSLFRHFSDSAEFVRP